MHYSDTLFQVDVDAEMNLQSVAIATFKYFLRPQTLPSILVWAYLFIIIVNFYHGLQVQIVLSFVTLLWGQYVCILITC